MSEEQTAETDESRSFEERVFARFDALDSRLNTMDARIEKLEMKQYDTKPIWEQALSAIGETKAFVGAGFDEFRTQIGGLAESLDSVVSKLTKLSTDTDNGLQGVARKIDVLNQYILDLRADQRYVDSRLEKIESQSKPS